MQRRSSRHRAAVRGTAAVAAAAALGLAATATAPALAAPAQDGPSEHTDMGVTGADAMKHLREISDISLAHASQGHRALGTPGYAEASEYVESVLEATGAYEVERQSFTHEAYTSHSVGFSADGTDYEAFSLSNAEAGEVAGAPLTVPQDDAFGDGAGGELGCEAGDFGADVRDSIVLVKRGTCDFGLKVTHASNAGAAGVVIINTDDNPLNATLGDRVEGNAPAVGLTQTDGDALRDKVLEAAADGADADGTDADGADGASAGLGGSSDGDAPEGDAAEATATAPGEDGEGSAEQAAEPLTGDLSVDASFDSVETWNILAETKAGDPENVEMLGAHLDGVAEGPGVNDNGSGTAALLAVAEKLAAQPTEVDHQVRFGFWGAEEVGLVGSTRYVESLDEAELARINSYLNFDMVGSENFIVGTLDSDGSDIPIPEGVEVPEGSAELEKIFTDFFDADGQPHVGTDFSGRSDYKAFMDHGIASSGLFSGADGIKTADEVEKFGGVEGVQYDRYYHTVDDTIENVSAESMDIFLPAIGFAAHTLAYDLREPTEKPTEDPTDDPTGEPTGDPSERPTDDPGGEPTDDPNGGQDDDGRGDGGRDDNADSLPRTGADTLPLVTAAAILLVGGGALVAATRSRRRG